MAMRCCRTSLRFLQLTVKSQQSTNRILAAIFQPTTNIAWSRCLSTTTSRRGMDEFFDVAENWGETEVKVGRGWRLQELRVKSNEDLHKLWYVLLKELNMLLTMEYACKQDCVLFPNPERIDKVKESMAHIETAIQERNKAYWQLETGETGERPGGVVKNCYGRREHQQFTECAVPPEFNPTYQKFKYKHSDTFDHLNKVLDEKLEKDQHQLNKKDRRYLLRLFQEFPDSDLELLQEQYPHLRVEDIRNDVEARGHHLGNVN